MARRNSTTKQSSGGGIPFENKAVAYVLTHLLTRSSPFDPPGGVVELVEVQRPATEWHLDDLVVTVRAHGHQHRLGFSVKSNEQITESGFPPDFVRLAWEQLLHDSSPLFEEGRDYLGLITVPADSGLKKAVFELLGLASEQNPGSLAAQVNLRNRTNDTVRKLFRSAECPRDLAMKHGMGDRSAGRLLRSTVWVPLDFEDQSSVSRARALERCQSLLRSGSADEAEKFWAWLLEEVANPLRRFGGDIDLGRLVDKLRGRFELPDFPDYGADWARLVEDAVSALGRVRSTIGGTVTLPRLPEHERIKKAFAEHRAVVLLGASGSGKSGVAKRQAESAISEGRALWLDASRLRARTLGEWRTHLGLVHPLSEIIRTVPAADALLVLDGLDRLFEPADFATSAEFVRTVRLGEEASPWRLLITCTPEAWERVRADLVSHGILPPELKVVNVELPDADELSAVWSAFPKLRPLRARYHLAPVLLRPKVLDLLATRATTADDLATVGESDLARWFWDREVAYGPHATLRAVAALQLAQHLADKLIPDISVSALSTVLEIASLPGIDELAEDRVIRKVDGRLAFDHDLYADWVRVRRIADMAEAGQLASFLASRLSSPVWHRALRLYGVSLLEQSIDLAAWTTAFKAAGSAGILAEDILLESTAFVSSHEAGLLRSGLWSAVTAADGRLLERLLNRIFHTATIPNPAVVETIVRQAPDLEVYAAAGARLPYPPYWVGVLRLLHAHRDEIPIRLRGLAARVADMWLRSTPQKWPLRKEAASLAIVLGEATLKEKEENDRLFDDSEPDQQVYRSVLASGYEEPETVTQIVLEASGRRDQRHAPPPRSEEQRVALRARHAALGASFSMPSGPLPAPWPHGPAFRVDGALQKAVLESDALQPLVAVNPELAREVLLALLINEPEHRHWSDDYGYHWRERLALESPRWSPPFYIYGPWKSFLATAEDEAVTAILQLIEHATCRWVEPRKRSLARERGCLFSEVEGPVVLIQVDGEEREYVGDARVFAWGVHGPDHGNVIQVALMALEKHLYDRVDSGADVTPLVQRIVTESRSLAIVGFLSVFGRRYLHYLRGLLRWLLVSPHVLEWTLRGSVGGVRNDFLLPKAVKEEYHAWYEMPHRKRSIRDCAISFFLNDKSLATFFEDSRRYLQNNFLLGGLYEGWPMVDHFVSQLDSGNYSESEGENGVIHLSYRPPQELEQKYPMPDLSGLVLLSLTMQCRQILDGEALLAPGMLNKLWESVQRLSEMGSVDDMLQPEDGLAGIAAVVVQYGGEWVSEHPDRAEWARCTLLAAALEELVDEGAAATVVSCNRLAFAVAAIPSLWADNLGDTSVRSVVARLVLDTAPKLVETFTQGAAAVQGRLGEDLARLIRVVLMRAELQYRIQQSKHEAIKTEGWGEGELVEDVVRVFRNEMDALRAAFVAGTITATVPSLDEIAPLVSLAEHVADRPRRRRPVSYRPIEESLLVAAYRGVPIPRGGETFWLPVWERIVLDTVRPLIPDNEEADDLEEEDSKEWREFFGARIADAVATIEDPSAGQKLWQPIISLGASASRWVTSFVRRWTDYALYPDAREPVVESWMAMIDAALSNPYWKAGKGFRSYSHRVGELWRVLLGMDRFDAAVWLHKLQPRVGLLRTRLAKWAESHLANSDNTCAFARFLEQPAAAELSFDGLIWLDREAQKLGDSFWGRKGQRDLADSAVFSLLVHVWGPNREMLRRNEIAFSAFRNLLQTLVSRQHAPALELADRVGSVF